MALIVKSRRARSSSSETPYSTTACRPSVTTSRRKVVTSCSARCRSSTPTVPYLIPTATVRGKSRCTSSGVADVAISKSDCWYPSRMSRRLPPTHQASYPAPSSTRAICRIESGISRTAGKGTLTSVWPAGRQGDHQLHSGLRGGTGPRGNCPHCHQLASSPVESVQRGHLPQQTPRSNDHRLALIDPPAYGRHYTGRHVATAKGHDDDAMMAGTHKVQQLTAVTDHHRDQRYPGPQFCGLEPGLPACFPPLLAGLE